MRVGTSHFLPQNLLIDLGTPYFIVCLLVSNKHSCGEGDREGRKFEKPLLNVGGRSEVLVLSNMRCPFYSLYPQAMSIIQPPPVEYEHYFKHFYTGLWLKLK